MKNVEVLENGHKPELQTSNNLFVLPFEAPTLIWSVKFIFEPSYSHALICVVVNLRRYPPFSRSVLHIFIDFWHRKSDENFTPDI